MFVDKLFSHDEDKTTIRSINDNYDYINMQFRWRKKTRIKCIKKNKNFTKNLFLFSSKKRRQNIIADCSTCLYYASFRVCGCQISRVQIPESELRCYKDTFSAWCFAYFKQSCNHAHALARHCGSTATNDLKTLTNTLEFSGLNESVIQPICVMSWDLDCIVCDWDRWINALTQPLLF